MRRGLQVDENADHGNSGDHYAAEEDRQILLEALDREIEIVLGHQSVTNKFGIVLNKRLGLPIIETGFAETFDRFQGVVRQCRHVWRFLPDCLSNIAPFAPDFQPVPRRRLAVAAALLILLPSLGLAQASRPIGSAPGAGTDLRAALGDCPADLLRRAWNEMLPLEAAAVEREVLALCTERSEAMAAFMAAQERLDGALAERRASAAASSGSTPEADPGPGDAGMERLRGEIESLRARIARLEGEPERPETEATLAGLRDELATAEADLAQLEGGAAPAGNPDVPPPGSVAAGDAAVGDPPAADPFPPSGTEPVAAAAPDAQAASDPPLTDGAVVSVPPPGTLLSPTPAQTAPGPQEGPTEWQVVFAVRGADGPWRVRLQGRREISFPVPVAAEGDGSGAAVIPTEVRPLTVTESDPPVDVSVGGILPDGLEVLAVTDEGVELGDPWDPDAEPVLVRFATAEDSEPGALAWDFNLLGGDEDR